MSKAFVLMIGHKSQRGKDVLAKEFCDKLGFVRYGFADKLKEVVADLYNFSWEQMYGSQKNIPVEKYINTIDSEFINGDHNPNWSKYFTPRRILQTFGQQQRSIFEPIWANYVINISIPKEIEKGKKFFVIPDFRFPNEYDFVKSVCDERGYELATVRLDRQIAPFPGMNDISETALDDWNKWDFVIENNSTIEDLYQTARKKIICC